MKIRAIISLLLTFAFTISCDKCKDKTKYFHAELYPAKRNTNYDWNWEKVYQASGDVISFGIETGYNVCEAYGAEELNSSPYEFYTDRAIVIGNDTILPKTNLLAEKKCADYILLNKNETSTFYSEPQYVIQIDNKTFKLKDYYTFYFRGYTLSGAEINDSTIVYVE